MAHQDALSSAVRAQANGNNVSGGGWGCDSGVTRAVVAGMLRNPSQRDVKAHGSMGVTGRRGARKRVGTWSHQRGSKPVGAVAGRRGCGLRASGVAAGWAPCNGGAPICTSVSPLMSI